MSLLREKIKSSCNPAAGHEAEGNNLGAERPSGTKIADTPKMV